MKTQNEKTIAQRSFLIATAMLLLLVSITPSFGQKDELEVKRATSLDGLAETGYMTKAEVVDDLEGTEDEYFYKFQTRPGKLTLIVEVTANETNAGAMLDLFGANSKVILSNFLVQAANGGSERVSKSVNISKKQDVVIRIKGLRYGSSAAYPGTYKILLEGAVSFNEAVPSDVPLQTNPPAASDTPVQINPPVSSDAPVQTNAPAAAPDTTVQVKTPSKADRVIEKAKSKSGKVLRVLDMIKEKKPN